MKFRVQLLALVAVLACAFPAVAGDSHGCDHDPADCAAKMASKIQQKAYLGIEFEMNDLGQPVISEVVEGSPAERAGFRSGDVLIAVNGVEYGKDNGEAVKKAWSALKPDSQATYVVARGASKTKLSATLGHVPDAVLARWVGEHIIKDHTEVKLASKD